MEIEYSVGDKLPLKVGSTTLFGRGQGYPTSDLTVSRNHIKLKLIFNKNQTDPKVEFEVVGKNPMWVKTKKDEAIKVFKKGGKGELMGGDLFCLSGKSPVWFEVKRKKTFENEIAERLESSSGSGVSDVEVEFHDIEEIDPAKEFGFLEMGHEFDHYPKKMLRDFKNFDWFLEESRKDSEDEEEEEKKRGGRRKRKKATGNGDNEDEEWTGESEEDNELISKSTRARRPGYITRSKDRRRPGNDNRGVKISVRKKPVPANEEEEEEDENTLAGFIVDDEEMEQEESDEEVEEEEEEEFDEENDDDEE